MNGYEENKEEPLENLQVGNQTHQIQNIHATLGVVRIQT
jgi:hypothetical protein